MAELLQHCCVCNKHFHVQFSYQMEELTQETPEGSSTQFRFFCSQDCVKRSHEQPSGVGCDACGTGFTVTRAAQVLFVSGKRRYACNDECRKQLLQEAQGLRLGQLLSRGAPSHGHAAPTDGTSRAASVLPLTPAPQAAGVQGSREPADLGGPRVIAVFNHKGGTGKTTSAVTLAAGLAAAGKRTLLVDTDAQGNVAVSLGVKPKFSLYHVLVMGMPLKDAVAPTRPNLDTLCANETLAAAELYLAGRQNRDRVLASRLAAARSSYDYVVVDCSPSLSLLNQNALVFADAVSAQSRVTTCRWLGCVRSSKHQERQSASEPPSAALGCIAYNVRH